MARPSRTQRPYINPEFEDVDDVVPNFPLVTFTAAPEDCLVFSFDL